MRLFALCLLLCVTAGAKTKTVEWQTGTLLHADSQHWTSTSGSTTTGHVDDSGNINANTSESKWSHTSFQVVVDDGSFVYFGEKTLNWRFQHHPRFTENAPIKFRLDGNKLIVVDDSGKEFETALSKRSKK